MTPAEFRAIRESLGLTQAELGERLNRHWVTISRYESGALAIPSELAQLMRMYAATAPAYQTEKPIPIAD